MLIFETLRSSQKLTHYQLSIMQRPSDEFWLGKLYIDKNYVEGQQNGSSCT